MSPFLIFLLGRVKVSPLKAMGGGGVDIDIDSSNFGEDDKHSLLILMGVMVEDMVVICLLLHFRLWMGAV